MPESRVDHIGASPAHLKGSQRAARLPRELHPWLVCAIAAFAALVMASYLWITEGGWANVLFTVAVILTFGALIVLASRRLLLATVLVAAVVGPLRAISFLKRVFGLARCIWKGAAAFQAYVRTAVLAANLLTLARHRMA